MCLITSPPLPPLISSLTPVPAGSPSPGGDVTVFVPDLNQRSLPTPFFFFYSVLVSVSVSVFMSLSIGSPLSHSVLLVLFYLIGPFNYISFFFF